MWQAIFERKTDLPDEMLAEIWSFSRRDLSKKTTFSAATIVTQKNGVVGFLVLIIKNLLCILVNGTRYFFKEKEELLL